MENVKALYILLLFAAFMVPLILFFCVCVYCGLATRRRTITHNRILYAMATSDYFQYKTNSGNPPTATQTTATQTELATTTTTNKDDVP